MYSYFVFLDRFLFELSCKNTHTHTDTHTHTHTHTHRDSNEYPIVAFSKNATITITNALFERNLSEHIGTMCEARPHSTKPSITVVIYNNITPYYNGSK